MQLLIDIGNTRTKWVLSEHGRMLSEVSACLNADIASSTIASDAKRAHTISIANVAGKSMAHAILDALQHVPTAIHFVHVAPSACGVINGYEVHQLGVDRWLALIAAHAAHRTSCLVLNAGTAITIDALHVRSSMAQAHFIGGLIVPGLTLMRNALTANTAQLNVAVGQVVDFPSNTQDAIYSGCISAAIGAIQQQWRLLSGLDHTLPKLVFSGGDAALLAQYLPPPLAERLIMMDNLVLRGLMQLDKEL